MNPARPPGPSEFRALRRATREYLVALDAALVALDAAPLSWAELGPLRTAIAVASGKRGSAFGTPWSIETMLSNLLGESGFAPEKETT